MHIIFLLYGLLIVTLHLIKKVDRFGLLATTKKNAKL